MSICSKKLFRVIALPMLSLSLSCCAYTTAHEIDPLESYNGFKVYECKPLVAIQQSGLSVVYVPNPSKAYAIRFGAFLAKNDVEILFNKDCGISKVKSNQDSTAIIELLQSALDKIAPNAVAAKETGGNTQTTRVELYEIIFTDEGSISRLKPLLRRDLPAVIDG